MWKEKGYMKTYRGELKDGMPWSNSDNYKEGEIFIWLGISLSLKHVKWVYHDNVWQRYEPKPKKVWGIPEVEGTPVFMIDTAMDGSFYVEELKSDYKENCGNLWLSEHHAEQHAKALNYINEFRALSDVPVDGVEQWFKDREDNTISMSKCLDFKLEWALYGYVANSREKLEQDHAGFPKIALAHKIDTWGFHGIVEEVL
jgi:hypothetical protein